MYFVTVRIKFEDYAKWKAVFDQAIGLRRSYGSMGVRIFRDTDQDNEVTILGEYEDLEKARQLFHSQEFRDAIRQAGVSAPPEVTYLDEVDQLPA